MNLKFKNTISQKIAFASLVFSLSSLVLFSACSDYQEEFDNAFGALDYTTHSSDSKSESSDGKSDGSSSSVNGSSSVNVSSSSAKSSSSVNTSSSSVNSSSSEKNSSSSAVSSSSATASSSSVSSSSVIKLASGAVLQKDVPLYWGDYSEPYDIVTIGSQTWMAENLYSLMSPYCFEDRKESCEMYGRLYTLSLTENACPDGWRVPSASDWKTLLEAVGNNSAKKLKSEKWAGLDEFGFGVLAAGSGAITGNTKRSFDASETCFWAESQTDGDNVDVLCFYTDENEAKWQSKSKTSLFSTRCIKGEKQATSSSSFVASSYVPPSGISYGTMRDGAGIEYRTVKIGDQNWMAENMALQNGESFCYGNETKNCTEYGRLYRWQTATEICPTGWHLPSKEEWEKLIAFVGGADSAGVRLKATDSWRSDGNGDDKYGFSAFSAGVGRFTSGAAYQSLGTSTVFWTSDAYSVGMNWFDANVAIDQYHGKEEALSVRCVEGFPPVVYGTMKDQVGIEYKTVTIDGKTWMAENLALQTANSFCYDNDTDNCVKYGRLYMWDAAMKACPEGWHLPTFTEFNDLLHYVVWDVSGKVLKSESGWDGTDGVGFNALPAGYMSNPSSYYYLDTRAFFWTQTVRDDLPYCIEMITGQNKADINVQCSKEVGYSVRCVKN